MVVPGISGVEPSGSITGRLVSFDPYVLYNSTTRKNHKSCRCWPSG
jgi:hypothetical protein